MFKNQYVAHGLVEVNKRYLLLHRASGRYCGDQWDIPGGSVEPLEQPHEAARRECGEETGLDCSVGDVISHFTNRDTEGRDIYFHTLTFSLYIHGPIDVSIYDEHQDFRWVTKQEALQLPLVWHLARTLESAAELQ